MSCTSSSTSDIPAPLKNWLKSQYPTLSLKESWLQKTISSYRGPRSAADGKLIEHVHQALLDADLKDVASRGALRIADTQHAKGAVVGAGLGEAVLVQIVAKLDIGVSAQAQLDVLEARRVARSTMAGRAALLAESAAAASTSTNDRASLLSRDQSDFIADGGDPQVEEERDHHMDEFAAAEEAALLSATIFPRSMLQLELSDGFRTVIGFEHRRIHALSMADTPLGAKLLLKDIRVKKGKLYLEPKGAFLKGGKVAAMDQDAEERLIDRLRSELGKPPLQRKGERGAERAQAPPSVDMPEEASSRDTEAAAAPRSSMHRLQDELQQQQQQGPPSSFDEAQFEEDEAVWAELQQQEGEAKRAAIGLPTAPLPSLDGTSRRPDDDEDGSSSPPPRRPLRKKLKQFDASADLTRPPRPNNLQGGEHKAEEEMEEEEGGWEGEVGASFLAGITDDEVDFVMMEKNDPGHPIVLSDSD